VRDKTRPIQITVAASDPILLAVAHGGLALASRDRASWIDVVAAVCDPLAVAHGESCWRLTITAAAD
jgi:hypothetical protein